MLLHSSLIFLAVSVLPTALGDTGPVVNTTSGLYVGVYDAKNEVDVFLGLRFADAPLARFTPTTPVSKAPEVPQNATAFGADCPQLLAPLAVAGVAAGPPLRGSNQSEDCFFVNGGGYFSGSGSEWNGTSLVRRSVATKQPMIFINFNYRTGVFGFLGSAHTPAMALNVGLQDQRDALRWIQNNAEAFGGDGSRITITGESAGGGSVHMHILYPDSQRTFRAGIGSSGTSLVSITPACAWHDRPGGAYNILGNITGCGIGPESFECLQKIPIDTFLPLARETYILPGDSLPEWVPCKGPQGSLIDEYPAKKLIDGDFLNVPIVTGSNRNEGNYIVGTTFIDITPQPSPDEANVILSGYIQDQATNFKNVSQQTRDKLVDLYAHPTDNLSNSSLFNRAAQFATDYTFLAPNRLFLDIASARTQDVWAYSFQQPIPGFPDFFGAFHTSDLYYLDIGFSPIPTGQLVSQLQDFYISFTNDLIPGSDWPKYSKTSQIAMRFLEGQVGPIADTYRRNQTDFLNRVDTMEEFGHFGF